MRRLFVVSAFVLLWLVAAGEVAAVQSATTTTASEATNVATNETFSGFTLGAGLVAALAGGIYVLFFR